MSESSTENEEIYDDFCADELQIGPQWNFVRPWLRLAYDERESVASFEDDADLQKAKIDADIDQQIQNLEKARADAKARTQVGMVQGSFAVF